MITNHSGLPDYLPLSLSIPGGRHDKTALAFVDGGLKKTIKNLLSVNKRSNCINP
jgi:hypothetical protein